MKEILKTIGINIAILCTLITLGNLASVAVITAYNAGKPKQYAQSHLFPNYRDVPWALDHFTEYDNLTKGYYKSFYAWRRPAFEGRTISISADGLRRTPSAEGAAPERTIAFFGGSTTWGTGADDATTIPAYFARQNPEFEAMNFGETGYIAHQSLNLFIERYAKGFRPDVVVSYDGVNDVWNRCRREHDTNAHSREHEIRSFLKARNSSLLLDVIGPMTDLAGRVKRTLASRAAQADGGFYNCHEDPAKAEQIARNLLVDWTIMKTLAEGYGGRFVGVLQPQAYDSSSALDHLQLDPALGLQYEAVYPQVIRLISSEFPHLQDNFADLRRALDQDDYYYIDWCHLSPNGNEIIARWIGRQL